MYMRIEQTNEYRSLGTDFTLRKKLQVRKVENLQWTVLEFEVSGDSYV